MEEVKQKIIDKMEKLNKEITNERNCLITQEYMLKWFLGIEEV